MTRPTTRAGRAARADENVKRFVREREAHATKYPLHTRLRAEETRRAAAADFYDFLPSEGFVLAKYHEHTTDGCGDGRCGMSASRLYPADVSPADLIGRFLGIDPKALEEEKRAMLDEIQKGHP